MDGLKVSRLTSHLLQGTHLGAEFLLAALLKIAELFKERHRLPKTTTEKAAERALRRFAREVLP